MSNANMKALAFGVLGGLIAIAIANHVNAIGSIVGQK